jgi:hypothetical protein
VQIFYKTVADKASLLTASGMLLHVFPSMSVSSLCEFPENSVYRHGGFNCFIKYLHNNYLESFAKSNFKMTISTIHYTEK